MSGPKLAVSGDETLQDQCDAASDAEFGAEPSCPGCDEPWNWEGYCGSCARVAGWHP